jgi:hypothetical protein
MDLYQLNFKRALCILNKPEIRENLISLVRENELDVNIKYVNSYYEAAKLINENEFDPYDHIILYLGYKNSKLNDFLEFLVPQVERSPNFLIQYTDNNSLEIVDLIED